MNMYPLPKDYLQNKPLSVDNIFNASKNNIYTVPKLNLNLNYKLIAPNYPTYPDLYSNNYMCMTTPIERTMKCRKSTILQLPNQR